MIDELCTAQARHQMCGIWIGNSQFNFTSTVLTWQYAHRTLTIPHASGYLRLADSVITAPSKQARHRSYHPASEILKRVAEKVNYRIDYALVEGVKSYFWTPLPVPLAKGMRVSALYPLPQPKRSAPRTIVSLRVRHSGRGNSSSSFHSFPFCKGKDSVLSKLASEDSTIGADHVST